MIDACSQESRPLLSIDDALDRIKAAVSPVSGTEKAALKNALGRVLAESVYSPINIPHDRNAAMDGYAFASRDRADGQAFVLSLAGTSWAGRPFQGQLQPGQCVRIFTGAVVPEQADSVIMQEHVQVQGQAIHFPADTRAQQNIREIGEDVKQGACLIAGPKMLTAVDLGLLASAGIDEVTVKRQLKIAYFSTGDELTSLGQPLEPGKIYDSNRTILGGLLADPGYSVADLGVIPDNKQLLEDSFIKASKHYDVIITTGGASVGEADYVKEILQKMRGSQFLENCDKTRKTPGLRQNRAVLFFRVARQSGCRCRNFSADGSARTQATFRCAVCQTVKICRDLHHRVKKSSRTAGISARHS